MKRFTEIMMALIIAALLIGGCKTDKQTASSSTPSAEAQPTGTATAPTTTPAPSAQPAAAKAQKGSDKPGKVITTKSGLKYQDMQVGTGEAAKAGDMVLVHYTGKLTDGTKFDSSRDRNEPFSFTLGNGEVIKGWDEGVAGMKVGGKRKLTIPADLGYGATGSGPIPANATLLFDVELLSIVHM